MCRSCNVVEWLRFFAMVYICSNQLRLVVVFLFVLPVCGA